MSSMDFSVYSSRLYFHFLFPMRYIISFRNYIPYTNAGQHAAAAIAD